MAYRKYKCNHNFFDTIDNEKKAYWLGIIATDGNISKNRPVIKLGFHKKDKDHLRKFLNDIESNHNIYNYGTRSFVEINISSAEMKIALRKLGITSNKSLQVCKPTGIVNHLERHFWRGCMDGDGCIGNINRKDRPSNSKYIYLTGSKSMIKDFSKFVADNLNITNKDPIRNNSIYAVRFGGNSLPIKVATLLYEDASVYLERKFTVYKQWTTVY